MTGTTLRSSTIQVNLAGFATGNPFRAAAGVSIVDETPGGRGVFGNASRAWTLANAGSVVGGAAKDGSANPGGIGVDMTSHASRLANSGTIAGGAGGYNLQGNGGRGGAGVIMAAAGTFSNSGAVTGGAGGAGGRASGDHGGKGGAGVILSGGHDDLINGAKGLIKGGDGTPFSDGAGGGGARLLGGTGTVSNNGTIDGGAGAGGYMYNPGGSGTAGLYMSGAANSVTNHGAIRGGNGGISNLEAGNAGIGINVSGSASIANFGAIIGGSGGYGGAHRVFSYTGYGGNGGAGAQLTQGGTITNHSGATILGGDGGNASISDVDGTGHGGLGGNGVNLSRGGTVENQSGASILGGIGGYAFSNHPNTPDPFAASGTGVSFGGTADSTLTNAGTIAGGEGALAVQFAAGNDLLVVDPGAVFEGGVDGGTGENTLELAASRRVGTISGIGTSFTNFQSIEVDANASWAGIKQKVTADTLTIDGVLSLKGASALEAAVGGTGTIKILGTSALATTGAVSATETIQFAGGNSVLSIVDTADFEAGIRGFATGDKIDLANADFAFNPSETVTFQENAGDTGGTLTVQKGANTVQLQLFGQFVASGFHLAADRHGGSAISYTPPPAAGHLAAIAAGGHG